MIDKTEYKFEYCISFKNRADALAAAEELQFLGASIEASLWEDSESLMVSAMIPDGISEGQVKEIAQRRNGEIENIETDPLEFGVYLAYHQTRK